MILDVSASEEATALKDLWYGLPKKTGTHCPQKSDFSPVGLRQHLKSIFMLERETEDTMRIRVAGTQIRDYYGREVTGENHFDLAPPELDFIYKKYYGNLSNKPCIGIFERPIRRPSGGEDRVKIIHFPLLDSEGKANIFIGVLVTERLPLNIDTIHKAATPSAQDVTIRYVNIGAGLPDD